MQNVLLGLADVYGTDTLGSKRAEAFPHMRFLHYTEVGGALPPHVDLTRTDVNGVVSKYTFILYTLDVEEGGELEFLYQSKRIKPKKGDFVLWPGGFTHMHRGNPPLQGIKYIYTGWISYI